MGLGELALSSQSAITSLETHPLFRHLSNCAHQTTSPNHMHFTYVVLIDKHSWKSRKIKATNLQDPNQLQSSAVSAILKSYVQTEFPPKVKLGFTCAKEIQIFKEAREQTLSQREKSLYRVYGRRYFFWLTLDGGTGAFSESIPSAPLKRRCRAITSPHAALHVPALQEWTMHQTGALPTAPAAPQLRPGLLWFVLSPNKW
ncbi:uncharacterized protein LOC116421524 [Sarcophilus harrisii]|uniref:uncharacterized protein LOC116421524 n=1 Tax=Sarcophilus harrisii TaxID=9305 RepID=UPI001301FE3C|nr:uncharacterized protein LOC116421524 [Sarcophilus harrisii]